MRAAPEPRVIAWLDAQSADTLYLATVSLAELLVSAGKLAEGNGKSALKNALMQGAPALFGDRLLSFDDAAARAYAEIIGKAHGRGLEIGTSDGMIAAVARSHGLTVASRNVEPFAAAGLDFINPWVDGLT